MYLWHIPWYNEDTLLHMSFDQAFQAKELPSFSIIIETENLGQAGIDDLCDTLDSLASQTLPVTNAREVMIVAAGHVSQEAVGSLGVRYPWVMVHRVDHALEYLESKQAGARMATGDIIVFVDSDVVYEPTWLDRIVRGFVQSPGAAVVAGDTRIRGGSVYATAIQLVWMMDTVRTKPHPVLVSHFDLNNFAIRRDVFLGAPIYAGLPLYRAHTVEVRKQLFMRGYSAVQVPGARGWHLPPGSLADLWYRLLVYGSDAVAKSEYRFPHGGTVVRHPSLLRRLVRIPVFVGWKSCVMLRRAVVIAYENPKRVGTLLAALPLAIVFLAAITLGSMVALIKPKAIFAIITAREAHHVV